MPEGCKNLLAAANLYLIRLMENMVFILIIMGNLGIQDMPFSHLI